MHVSSPPSGHEGTWLSFRTALTGSPLDLRHGYPVALDSILARLSCGFLTDHVDRLRRVGELDALRFTGRSNPPHAKGATLVRRPGLPCGKIHWFVGCWQRVPLPPARSVCLHIASGVFRTEVRTQRNLIDTEEETTGSVRERLDPEGAHGAHTVIGS